MTRRVLVIVTLLLGLIIGYLAGCSVRVRVHVRPGNPQSGQHWRGQSGDERIVRCVTREGGQVRVWWYRQESRGADRHCTLATWRAWARTKGARPE